MRQHRSALRLSATLGAALLIAATISGGALASPGRSSTTSSQHMDASRASVLDQLRSGVKFTHRTAGTRPSVNVRQLAARKPTVRPMKALPFLTRTPASTAKPSGPRTGILAAPAPIPATTNSDGPVAQTGFSGLSSASGPLTNVDPPDPWVAVGPEHVVQAVNLSLRVTDRQNGSSTTATLPDFFNLPTDPATFDSDPHVIYDSLHGRWLATEVSWDCAVAGGSSFGTGYVDFAISRTADPTGTWDLGYVFYNDALPDFPAPGTSTDKVGIGVNVFVMTHTESSPGAGDCIDGTNYDGTDSFYMDWADLLNGGSFDLADLALNTSTFTPRVAVQAPATSPAIHEVVGYDDLAGGLGFVYFTVTGSIVAGTQATDAVWDLTGDSLLASNQDPPQPVQPGPDTIAGAVDLRVTDAVWEGNRLVLVSTYPCGTGPRDCVRVSELDTTGASATVEPTVTQDFVVGQSGKDLFMGGVGLSGDGTLHVAWTRSSSTDNPSSFTAHQVLGDALNSISPDEQLAAGTGAYTGGERWGDYVGVAQDPQVPSQVWNANQYSGGADWLTKVTPLRTPGTTYVPITPVRTLDTRFGTGLSGMFVSSKARTWKVTNGLTIPDEAVAVTGNVTVTGQQTAGYVSVTVTPTNSPPSSTINFPFGQTRANNVTIPLSSAGTLSAVFKGTAGKKTHLVFDVTGYFLADNTGATLTPITPVRVLSTVTGTGLVGKFDANVPRTLLIGDGVTIPTAATAITGNLTIVSPSGGGYASVTPDPTATPATSTINFPAGATRANGVFAPLNLAHELSIVYKSGAGAKADVILDVTGYFVPGTAGLVFVPLNPSRIMDTRPGSVLSGLTGTFASSTPRTLDVDGHWGVPIGALAVTGNLTIVGANGGGYASVTPDPTATPATSTINFPAADTMANGIVAPLNGSGDSSLVYKSAGGKTTHMILDLSGWFE